MSSRIDGLLRCADEANNRLEKYVPDVEVRFSSSLSECMGQSKYFALKYDAKEPETPHAKKIMESGRKLTGARYVYVEWANEHGVEESIFITQEVENDGMRIITEIDPALSLPGAYFVKNIYAQSGPCAFNLSELSPVDIYMTTDANAKYVPSIDPDSTNSRYIILGSLHDISNASGVACGVEVMLHEIGHARSLRTSEEVILGTKRETIVRTGPELIKHTVRFITNKVRGDTHGDVPITLHPIYKKHATLLLNSEYAASVFAVEVLNQMATYKVAHDIPRETALKERQMFKNRLAYHFNTYVQAFRSLVPNKELDVSYTDLTIIFDNEPNLANLLHQLHNSLRVTTLVSRRMRS